MLKRSNSKLKSEFCLCPPIKPFISSTFQDFQEERDFLVKKIFPQLDSLCRNRGTYFAPVDLRWGISESQVESGQVIQLCLDYIIKCVPFFIGIIGERYGSQRGQDAPLLPRDVKELPEDADCLDVNFMVAASGGHDWVLEEEHQKCSITELEIIQAAFRNKDSSHCYFYIRQQGHLDLLHKHLSLEERQEKLKVFQPEDDYSDERVRDLKGRVIKHGLPVKYFKTKEQLGKVILQDWVNVINLLCPPLEHFAPSENELFMEWVAQDTFAETRRRVFVRTPQMDEFFATLSNFAESALEELDEHCDPSQEFTFNSYLHRKKSVAGRYQSIQLLVGDRGCGKTSALANWVTKFTADHPDINVLTHFVGSSAHSYDITSCMKRFIIKLRGEFYDDTDNEACSSVTGTDLADFHSLCESFIAAAALAPCVFVLDGVDELGGCLGLTPQQIKEMCWLPSPLPPQCKMIISTSRSDFSYKSLSQRPDTTVHSVPSLTDTQHRAQVIREQLAVYCKYLDEEMLSRIVKSKLSERPLFLSILCNELRVYGVYSKLNLYLDSYLEAISIRDLWVKVIQRWISDYGWTTGLNSADTGNNKNQEPVGWVADALRLIVVSRGGLSQSEILTILGKMGYKGETEVTTFDWALFCSAAPDALFEKPGGLLGFFHQNLKEAVEHSLLQSNAQVDPEVDRYGRLPASYTKRLYPTDKPHFHQLLADYFWSLPHSPRRTSELPWQLERCGDTEKLIKLVSDINIVLELCSDDQYRSKKLDLIGYWKVLKVAGYDLADSYWDMLHEISGNQVLRSTTSAVHSQDYPQQEEDCGSICSIPVIGSKIEEDSQTDSSSLCVSVKPLNTEKLVLVMKAVGLFLAEMACFQDSEDVLLQAHTLLLKNQPMNMEKQHLLCNLEEIIGNQYLYQLNKNQAMHWFHRALKSVENLIDDVLLEAGDIRKLQETKGHLLDELGKMKTHDHSYRKAEILLKKAKKCMDGVGSVPGTATVQYHLGVLRMYQQDYTRAEQYMRQALSIRERWFGKSHPEVASILNDLAGLLCHKDNQFSYNKKQAEYLFRRTLQIRERCLGKDHLLVATTLYHLGRLLKMELNHQAQSEALTLLKRALDIRTTKLGPEHHITKPVRRSLSQLEASIQSGKGQRQSNRSDHQPYSSLSWHEAELVQKTTSKHQSDNLQDVPPKNSELNEARTSKTANSDPNLEGDQDNEREGASDVRGWHGSCTEDSVDENDYDDLVFDRRSVSPNRNRKLTGISKLNQHVTKEATQMHSRTSDSNYDEKQINSIPIITESNASQNETDIFLNTEGDFSSSQNFTVSPEQHLDNYSKNASFPKRNMKKKKSARRKEFKTNFRPKSAPVVQIENPYQNYRIAPNYHVTPSNSRPISQRASSAPVRSQHYAKARPLSASEGVHSKQCYQPGPHTIDIHNAYSVNGPNSHLNSLLGEPPFPHGRNPEILHQSAWYHVPGRYVTVTQAYPPKRAQHRVPQGRGTGSKFNYSDERVPATNDTRGRKQGSPRRGRYMGGSQGGPERIQQVAAADGSWRYQPGMQLVQGWAPHQHSIYYQ